ncbi:MAG: AI-2E family transporter [Phocaeicola sp.]|nr:AI-2E family transporter [Phocaeicola sp.]MDD7449357.1 AI-2E family transporter [Prevotellaceae bacterium]MDY5938568.1 AI-2E family transporter [Phocaeicola sp.]
MPILNQKKITFDSFIRGILAILLLVGILMLVNKLGNVLLPFFLAWFVAYLVYPIVLFFQQTLHFRSRILSIIATMMFLMVILGLAIWILFPPVVSELLRLKNIVEAYLLQGENGTALSEVLNNILLKYLDAGWLQNLINAENLFQAIQIITPKISAIISTSFDLVVMLFTAFVTLLYFIFILLDYERIGNNWITLLPKKYRPVALKLTTDVVEGMNRYFRGQALIATCVGVLFSIGFLMIDFPLAIVLGLFIGLLNMVPYLQIIGFIPTILLALLKSVETGTNFWGILGLALLVFAVVQIIQDAYLTPRIMGKVTGLNPAVILLSLSIWGSLMGFLGMIIALPATTLLLSYYKHYIHRKNLYDEYLERNLKSKNTGVKEPYPNEVFQENAKK